MKQAENNEIDTLLRGLARGTSTSARLQADSGAAREDFRQAAGAHLEADELSSYAEGKLPAAARARYTRHLADCDDCRTVVAQLALSLRPITSERPDEQMVIASTWREKLGALFAPNVLRYAMPALALIAVAAVGLFVWNLRGARESLLAQKEPAVSAPSSSSEQTKESQGLAGRIATGNSGRTNQEQQPSQSPSTPARGDETKADKVGASAETAAAPDREEKDAPKKEAVAAARPQPSYASEPAAAARPPQPKAPEVAKEQPAKVADEARTDDAQAAQKRDAQRGAATGSVTQSGPAAAKPASGQEARKMKAAPGEQARGGGDARARRSESESETRTVEGRHFRRENGVWTDTAYDSSRSAINVVRHTEQYRALVADEPEIGRIAQQLSGEVVVVWKGRAYRIR